jgi:hypothetical protein
MKKIVNNVVKSIPRDIELEKMCGDDIFWIKFWRITGVVFVLFIATLASCEYKTTEKNNEAVVKLVQSGASPESARCAIRGSQGTDNVQCTIHYAKKD